MRVRLCLPEVDPHHVVLHLAPEEHRREDGDGAGVQLLSEGARHDVVGRGLHCRFTRFAKIIVLLIE